MSSEDPAQTAIPGHAAGDGAPPTDDEFAPVLPGPGASDYERYLRTDELLALQKRPEQRAHHDELLFQTVHQSSELWLQLAAAEVEAATAKIAEGAIRPALRLLRRAALCMQLITRQLDMLEQLSPWEYTRHIRPVLGHGSGFDSPGFGAARRVSPALGQAFHALRRAEERSLVDVYREGGDLYDLAEALTEWDERLAAWRARHFQVVSRIIGDHVVGTQGTPVELLGELIKNRLYPELWEVRNELTELAKREA